jgi:hypothetical protein
VSVIALHRNEARHAFFTEARAHPIFFDQAIGAWVVAGAAQCEEILLSPNVAVYSYSDLYEEMAARSPDLAFPNLLFAFKYLPPCLNGNEHMVARRRLAQFLLERKNIIAAAAPGIVDRWIGAVQGRTKVELIAEVLQPMAKEFLAALSGIDLPNLVQSTAVIFDRMMGGKRRRQVDNELGVVRSQIRRSLGPHATDDEEGIRMAILIFGHDTLSGAFGESLYQILKQNTNVPLSEIDYPSLPNETSVAYAERIVTRPFSCEGTAFRVGDRIRMMLQSFLYTDDPADCARIFSAGSHTCLGRQLSLDLWSTLTRRLSQISAHVEILDYALRDEDYMFINPSKLLIGLKLV